MKDLGVDERVILKLNLKGTGWESMDRVHPFQHKDLL